MAFQFSPSGYTPDSSTMPVGVGVPYASPQRPGVKRHPAEMTPEERAQYLYDTINSEISLPQWQAWANKVDPGCPPNRPFRTDKQVSGGDQRECVETPDNCPTGTRAFGANQCLPESDPKFGATGGVAPGAPGAVPGAPAAPQIGVADLLNNMTFQRMFGSSAFGKPTPTQVGQGNLFNLGQGQQARVLEGGALQWGAGGFDTSPLTAPGRGGPASGGPTGIADLVTQMNRRKGGFGAPRVPRTFSY